MTSRQLPSLLPGPRDGADPPPLAGFAGGPAHVAPWADAMRARLRALFGTGSAADFAIGLAVAALSESTYDSYGPKFMQFVNFCTSCEPPLSFLPATSATCALFLGHLAQRRKKNLPNEYAVQPESAQPYLSAINKVHTDALGWPEGPALGPLITSVRQGWAMWRARDHPERLSAVRVPLPAQVASDALDAGTALAAQLAGGTPLTPARHAALRAHVFVTFGFLLMARSDTDAHLSLADVSLTAALIAVLLRHEKGARRRRARRKLVFPVPALGGIAPLLAYWVRLQSSTSSSSAAADGSFWRIPGDPSTFSSSSDACTEWLQLSCTLLGHAPPPGESWSSHSLRKGAASAASALLVPLNTICFIGGWSIKSKVVHDYVDPTVLPSPAGRRFFQWCLPDA
jgi:hypothetical protein